MPSCDSMKVEIGMRTAGTARREGSALEREAARVGTSNEQSSEGEQFVTFVGIVFWVTRRK